MIGLLAALAAASLPLIAHPDWIKSPTVDDLDHFYPRAALEDAVAGHVTLDCVVTADGHLRDCAAVEETPSAYGFGAAAVGLSGRFQVRPMRVDGRAIEARVQLEIRFALPPRPAIPTLVQAEDCVANVRSRLEQDPRQDQVWKELDFWTWSLDEDARRLKIRPSDLESQPGSRGRTAAGGAADSADRCRAQMSAYVAQADAIARQAAANATQTPETGTQGNAHPAADDRAGKAAEPAAEPRPRRP